MTFKPTKLQIVGFVFCAFIFLAANRVEKYTYSPYETLVWEIKANEGYRPWWYKDGWNNGKQAYSIGFGWNDLGQRRRHEIKQYTVDGHVSYDEATKIMVMELQKYGTLNKDKWRDIALKLYAYNCGLGNAKPEKLGRCCGAKWGCGNRNKNIKKSHSRRRKFELALWHHDWQILLKMTSENREKCKKLY